MTVIKKRKHSGKATEMVAKKAKIKSSCCILAETVAEQNAKVDELDGENQSAFIYVVCSSSDGRVSL